MLENGWKRLLSGFLALVLVIGMLPPTAVWADEDETTPTSEATEVAETTEITETTEVVETAEETEAPQTEPEETAPEETEETAEATEATLLETVANVQALIDALPTVETVTAENYDAVQEAYDAYDALTDEEKTLVQGAEKFETLFDCFNAQVDTSVVYYSITQKIGNVHDYRTEIKLVLDGETEESFVADQVQKYPEGTKIQVVVTDKEPTAALITVTVNGEEVQDNTFTVCENAEVKVDCKYLETWGGMYDYYSTAYVKYNFWKDATTQSQMGENPTYFANFGHLTFADCGFANDYLIDEVTGNWVFNLEQSIAYELGVKFDGKYLKYDTVTIQYFPYNANTNSYAEEPVALGEEPSGTGSAFAARGRGCEEKVRISYVVDGTCLHLDRKLKLDDGRKQWPGSWVYVYIRAKKSEITESYIKAASVEALRKSPYSDQPFTTEDIILQEDWENKSWFQADVIFRESERYYGCTYENVMAVSVKIVATISLANDSDKGTVVMTDMDGSIIADSALVGDVTIQVTPNSGNKVKSVTVKSENTDPVDVALTWDDTVATGTFTVETDKDYTVVVTYASTSGTCGENLTWTLDENGLLTISGTGDMPDYDSPSSVPWYSNRSNITAVVIEEGVTSIGDYAFFRCSSLASVTIPEGVTSIGFCAFQYCSGLSSITIPEGVTSIDGWAFDYCSSLASITIPKSVTSIDNSAFAFSKSLTDVYYGSTVESWLQISVGADYYYLTSATIHCVESDGITRAYKAGNCWGDLTWTLDEEGTLTIFGTGEMHFYDEDNTRNDHWDPFCDKVTTVFIQKGITSIDDDAFSYYSSLTGITIPESITSIGSSAFDNCPSLTDVYYGGTQAQWEAITIGSNNSALTNATIHAYVAQGTCGENLTWTLDEEGTLTISGTGKMTDFSGWESPDWESNCSDITAVVIEEGVTSIGNCAFPNCSNLTSVTIPKGVTSIGAFVFSYCSALTSIELPDGVTSIGYGAFEGCSGLTKLTIPGSVTSISESMYYGCSGISSAGPIGGGYNIEFGWTESIPDYAFAFCDSLTTITLPETITSIGANALACCFSLTSVTIPASVTSIAEGAFNRSYNLTGIYVDSNNAHYLSDDSGVLYNKAQTQLIQAPGKLSGSYEIPTGVTTVGMGAFIGCENLSAVTIPDSVTSMGEYAFYDCSSLNSITIPEGVISIGDYAFGKCSSLTGMTLPEGLTSIAGGAFDECSGLTSITIPKGVTSIGYFAFGDCTGLTSVTLPEGLTSIGESAFHNCSRLTGITIPDNVTSIGEGAFSDCSGLTSVTIPESVTSISRFTFGGCTGLTDVYYGGAQEQWEAIAIEDGNDSLTNAIIHYEYKAPVYVAQGTCGDNLTWTLDEEGTLTISGTGEMGDYEGFYSDGFKCPWYGHKDEIQTLVVEKGVTSIGENAFYWLDSMTSVTLPEGITSIGKYAFYMCEGLTNITLPEGVVSIGYGAFGWCSGMTSITFPQSLTSIGAQAFGHCESLTGVTIPAGVTSIGSGAFVCFDSLTGIYVDSGNAYYSSDDAGVLYNKAKTELIQAPATISGSYEIPNGVTVVGPMAFMSCDALCSVNIPESVTNIGKSAFAWCTSLTSITIPESVTSIDDYAFNDCTCLTDVYYSGTQEQWAAITINDGNICLTNATIHYVPAYVAQGTCGENLTWTLDEEGTLTISGTGKMTDYPSYSDTPWYSDRADITSVVIEKGVTGIGSCAFAYCISLTEVTIPDSVTSIGSGAFRNCPSLTAAQVSGTLYELEDDIFDAGVEITYTATTGLKLLKVKQITKASVYLSWNEVIGATGYDIYRKQGSDGTYSLLKSVTGTETNNYSLTSGLTYYYKVQAYTLDGGRKVKGVESEEVAITIACLTTPEIAIASQESGSTAEISWSKVNGAAGYEVYRATSMRGTYMYLGTADGTKLVDTALAEGCSYYYKVRAFCMVNGETEYSAWSDVYKFQLDESFIGKPDNLSVRMTAPGTVYLSWDPVEKAEGYDIYRQKENGQFAWVKRVTNHEAYNYSLTIGNTYGYKVSAYYYNEGEKISGKQSEAVTVEILTVGTPYIKSVTHSAAGTALVKWSSVGSADGYELYRSRSENGTYALMKSVAGIETSNYNLTVGVTYYYKVRAYVEDENGVRTYGAYSAACSVTIGQIPLTRIKSVTQVGSSSAKVIWAATNNAEGYEVWRRTGENGQYELVRNISGTAIQDRGLIQGETYTYKVRAYKVDGEKTIYGDFSGELSVKITSPQS